MYWFLYLIVLIFMQILVWVGTPFLACCYEIRSGWCDNNSYQCEGPRLWKSLSWFDTPDNNLLGDSRWAANHSGGYWSRVGWLYRNSLYGFKWTVLGAKITSGRIFDGNVHINYVGPIYGTLSVTSGKYWQWKKVTPSKLFKGYCWVLNFGWLLDDPNKDVALFMFSPRIKRIKYATT